MSLIAARVNGRHARQALAHRFAKSYRRRRGRMPNVDFLPGLPAAMNPIVYLGHPGHELRIFDWLRQQKPPLWAITDGSGSEATSRVHLSAQVLTAAGIPLQARFGQCSDKAFYALILSGDPAFFLEQVEALAQAIVTAGHDTIVSDADEGYSTTHDLCHVIAGAAAARASALTGRAITHLDFPLVGNPRGDPARGQATAVTHDLDEPGIRLKVEVALNYGRAASPALLAEVEQTLAKYGTAAFAREMLFVARRTAYGTRFDTKPYYETYGETRAAEGCYDQIIRYREHMMPLADKIQAHAVP